MGLNELLFIMHIIIVAGTCLIAGFVGKESLVAIICTQGILSNLFVSKQIMLFGLNVTSSDVFAVGSIIGLNLLQEYFGPKIVKITIFINFFILFFFLTMSQFHVWYQPNNFDSMHVHCYAMLHLMPRLTLASITTYMIVQIFDFFFYRVLSMLFCQRFFTLRTFLALLLSQIIDTILFSFLGLYGVVGSLLSVITMSLIIKLIIICLSSPIIGLSKKWYRHADI